MPTFRPAASPLMSPRDAWLTDAVDQLRDWLGELGLPVPAVRARAGVMPPSGHPNYRIEGYCLQRTNRIPEVVVSHDIDDAVAVLSVLTHELIHAADTSDDGHGPWFRSWSLRVGLVGPAECGEPGIALSMELRKLARHLGPYPMATMTFSAGIDVTAAV